MKEKKPYKFYTKEYIRKHADVIYWKDACALIPFDLLFEVADDYSDMFDWFFVSNRMDLTADFIKKYSDKLFWDSICYFTKIEVLSSLADDFSDKISLDELNMRTDFSYDLIKRIENKKALHESN